MADKSRVGHLGGAEVARETSPDFKVRAETSSFTRAAACI